MGPSLVVALLVVATTAVVSTATGPTLVVTAEDGERIVVTPVDEDTEVVVEYTHSVEQTLVRDVYVPEDGQLVMTRMEFSSFGAGLPAQADVTVRDGRFVYRPPRSEHETLRVETGTVADHDLVVGDERYDIATLADGGSIELTVRERWRTFT
ncbi:DUF1850 domain-containing protein [Halorubrum sp. 48-1-W]|nr:DUF1850 domain-containing protein [Halorubrum sp. 48-1-W]